MAFKNSGRGYLDGTTVGPLDLDAGAVNTAALADGNVTNGKLASGAVTGVKILDGSVRVSQKRDKRSGQLDFIHEAVSSKRLGGATTGATGDRNQFLFPDGFLEGHVKGTETILVPVLTALGWDIGMDQTAADGYEFCPGILGRLDGPAFKIGTDAAFQTSLRFVPADASGCNPIVVGFRKAEGYQAARTSYADYAGIGIVGTSNPGKIQTEERTGGSTTTTDTTNTWADAATKTLTVKVSAAGVVTYQIDGVAPTTVSAGYTFTPALVVVPFLYFLQAADLCDTLELIQWKWGLQTES